MSRYVTLILLALALLAVSWAVFGRSTLAACVVLAPVLAMAGLVARIAEGRAVAIGLGRAAHDDRNAHPDRTSLALQ